MLTFLSIEASTLNKLKYKSEISVEFIGFKWLQVNSNDFKYLRRFPDTYMLENFRIFHYTNVNLTSRVVNPSEWKFSN